MNGRSTRSLRALQRAMLTLLASVAVTACAVAPMPSTAKSVDALPSALVPTPGTTASVVSPSERVTPAPSAPFVPGELKMFPLPALDELMRGAAVSSLAAGPAGFVMLGNDRRTGALASWTSADGGDWVRQWLPGSTFGGGTPDQLVGGSFGYLALGWSDPPTPGSRQLWSSPDGVTWRPTAGVGLPSGELEMMGSGPAGVIIVGAQAAAAAVAVSGDGESWHPADFPGGAITNVFLALALPDGFLVLGAIDNQVTDNQGGSAFSSTPVAWRSPDGVTWTDASGIGEAIRNLENSVYEWQTSPWGPIGATNAMGEVGRVAADTFELLPAPPDPWGRIVGGPAGLLWVQGANRSASCSAAWQFDGGAWQPLININIDRACIDAAAPFVLGTAAGSDAMLVLAQLGVEPDRVAWLVRAPDRPPAQTSAVDTVAPSPGSIPDALAIRLERPTTCPTGPRTVDELLAIERSEAVACFGDEPMTFRAWVVDPGEGYGGVCTPFTPTWIRACVLPDYQLRSAAGPNDGTLAILDAMRSPSASGDLRGVGRWVRVTGHLDDPVSSTCRAISDEPQLAFDRETPAALAVLECRRVFVVDDIITTP